MPTSYHRRWRKRYSSALAASGALLLAVCGPTNLGAAETEASEQRQKLEHLRDVNADARRNADELRRQMDELQAEATDYGLLLALEDAAFATNEAGLSSAGHRRIDALGAFLRQHPDRTVAVNGHAGVPEYRHDRALSARRADAIKAYLMQRGISARRLTGRGNSEVLADYGAASQQQPKRRVEVLVVDPLTSVPLPAITTPGT